MEGLIVIGLLIAMWVIALVPVEKLTKKLQDKGILKRDYLRGVMITNEITTRTYSVTVE